MSFYNISTHQVPGCRAGIVPLLLGVDPPVYLWVYDGDDPATYTSSMHRVQPRTNIAYIHIMWSYPSPVQTRKVVRGVGWSDWTDPTKSLIIEG